MADVGAQDNPIAGFHPKNSIKFVHHWPLVFPITQLVAGIKRILMLSVRLPIYPEFSILTNDHPVNVIKGNQSGFVVNVY